MQKTLKDAKSLLRRRHLRQLRNMAKSDPLSLQNDSTQICSLLYDRINEMIHNLQTTITNITSNSTMPMITSSSSSSLLICAYLPLFYEVDLKPLLLQLWQEQRSNCFKIRMGNASIFLPVVLTPEINNNNNNITLKCIPPWEEPQETAMTRLASAMLFVEVFSEEDLMSSFEIRGRYQLTEPKDEVMQELFNKTRKTGNSCEINSTNRRCIACDKWESLFPSSVKPVNLIELDKLSQSNKEDNYQLLVLTPGVLFDSTGGRLGKGGGYYDRFLQYNRSVTTLTNTVHVWGIAREIQLLPLSTLPDNKDVNRLPVCQHNLYENGEVDAVMDAVITPTSFCIINSEK